MLLGLAQVEDRIRLYTACLQRAPPHLFSEYQKGGGVDGLALRLLWQGSPNIATVQDAFRTFEDDSTRFTEDIWNACRDAIPESQRWRFMTYDGVMGMLANRQPGIRADRS